MIERYFCSRPTAISSPNESNRGRGPGGGRLPGLFIHLFSLIKLITFIGCQSHLFSLGIGPTLLILNNEFNLLYCNTIIHIWDCAQMGPRSKQVLPPYPGRSLWQKSPQIALLNPLNPLICLLFKTCLQHTHMYILLHSLNLWAAKQSNYYICSLPEK